MYKVAVCIAALEIAGLLSFIAVSRYYEVTSLRYLIFLIVFVAVALVTYSSARRISYKRFACVAFIASVVFISVDQFLGFNFFPGLAKDIDFISFENAIRTVVMLVVGTAGHILLLAVVKRIGIGEQ